MKMPPKTTPKAFEEPQSDKDRLSARLTQLMGQLQDFHGHLQSKYAKEALDDFAQYFYDIRSEFRRMLSSEIDPFYHWVNHTEGCQRRIRRVILKAKKVALYFEEPEGGRYSRIYCKMLVDDLLIAIQNLKTFNNKR